MTNPVYISPTEFTVQIKSATLSIDSGYSGNPLQQCSHIKMEGSILTGDGSLFGASVYLQISGDNESARELQSKGFCGYARISRDFKKTKVMSTDFTYPISDIDIVICLSEQQFKELRASLALKNAHNLSVTFSCTSEELVFRDEEIWEGMTIKKNKGELMLDGTDKEMNISEYALTVPIQQADSSAKGNDVGSNIIIYKSLKRLWCFISILIVAPITIATINDADESKLMLYAGIVALGIWWGLFWVVSRLLVNDKKNEI